MVRLFGLALLGLQVGCASSVGPVADAGAQITGDAGEVYAFDGASSVGEGLRFDWSLTDGPDAPLYDADTAWPMLIPEEEGVYTLTLRVCDAWDRCDESQTVALVGERAQRAASHSAQRLMKAPAFSGRLGNGQPEAAATARSRPVGGRVILDGSASSDPDGDTLRYRWSFASRPAGSALTDEDIVGGDTAKASFWADVNGAYSLKLTVRDVFDADAVTLPDIVLSTLDDHDPWPYIVNGAIDDHDPWPYIVNRGLDDNDPWPYIVNRTLDDNDPWPYIVNKGLDDSDPWPYIVDKGLDDDEPWPYIIGKVLDDDEPWPYIKKKKHHN